MAIYREDFVDVDLESGNVFRSFCNHRIGEGDVLSQRFGVRIMKNKEPVNLTGATCVGFFIRPDGVTLVLEGSVSGNTAYIALPQAAFAKTGQFTLAIKVSGDGFDSTMRIVDGTVDETTTGAVSDPASAIPSLEELMAVIERAEDAAEEIGKLSVTATNIEGTRYKIVVTIET